MGFLWVLTVTAAVAGASSAGGLRAASGGDDGDGGRHLAAKPKKETSSKVCKGGKEKGTCEDLGCQWNKCAPWASKKKGKNKKKKGKAKKIPSPTASPTVDEHDSAGEHDFVITGKLRLGDFNSESTEDTVAFMNLVAPFASDGHMVVTKEESAVQRNGQVSFDMVFSLGSSITGGLTSLLQETALQFLGDAAATLVNFAGTTTAFGEILRRFLNGSDAGLFGGRYDLILELLETFFKSGAEPNVQPQCIADTETCWWSCDGDGRSCDFWAGRCECDSGFDCFCEDGNCYAGACPFTPTPETITALTSPAVAYDEVASAAIWSQGLWDKIKTPGYDPTVDSSTNDVFSSTALQDAIASLGGIQGGPAAMLPDPQGVYTNPIDHFAWPLAHYGPDLYPFVRELRDWDDDFESDAAFAQWFFAGIGQSFLTKEGDGYVARMEYAGAIDVKPGAGKYGGDAYFDANTAVTKIVYEGVEYTPASGAAWIAAKAKCRGTAVALATALDHLMATHLVFANGLAWAVPTLPPNHAMRRLLWPHIYKSTSVNLNAAAILTSEGGLFHRGWALSKAGVIALFDYAKANHPLFQWATVPERFAATGMPADLLPLHEDGLDFYEKIVTYFTTYVDLYYASDQAVASDADLQNFFAVLNEHALNQDLPAATTKKTVVDVLASYVFYVTGYHAHGGSLGAEIMNAEMAPQSWYAADASVKPVSPPNNFLHVAITMCATSALQLSITGDDCAIEKSCGFAGKVPYFHNSPAGAAAQSAIPATGYPGVFAGIPNEAQAVAANKAFVDSLVDLQGVIEARNVQRHACSGGLLPAVCRAYNAFDVSFVEASVAI